MDNANLWLAIKARAATDTGAGGLFNASTPLVSGIYPNIGPENQDFPWIVFDLADTRSSLMFKQDMFFKTVQFGVYVPEETESIADPHQRASDIIQRLYGDYVSATQTPPTFGFHRHLLVLSGTWTGMHMQKTGDSIEHEDGVLHFVETYSVGTFK